MPHVTIDARWLDTSGIGTYLTNILPGIIKQNSDIDFLLLGYENRLNILFGEFQNTEVKHFYEPMYSISEQLKYLQIIPGNTDLYFATHFNIPVLSKHKLMVTVYDLFHLANPHLVNSFIKSAYARLMFQIIRRRAKNIVTISEFSKTEFNRLVGAPASTIHAIPLGITFDPKHVSGVESRLSSDHGPYILYVGNIKPHKNLNRLIEAFLQVKEQIPHKLVLVGKKEGFLSGDGDISKLVDRHSDRIILTGFVDSQKLNELYYCADVFVFPSLYEGFGFPPLEAMARQCPTLVSNAASIPEVCGDASIYFDPKNIEDLSQKLYQILSNYDIRVKLIRKGLERINHFDWDKTIELTSTVLRDTLSK